VTTVLPLVSIIVRTVGRPELTEALASIAAQSHTNIETLIVDARGDGLPSIAAECRADASVHWSAA